MKSVLDEEWKLEALESPSGLSVMVHFGHGYGVLVPDIEHGKVISQAPAMARLLVEIVAKYGEVLGESRITDVVKAAGVVE